MTNEGKRCAIYMRVSTGSQTVENQRQALLEAIKARGWVFVNEYADEGISGAKGRKDRPQLDKMLKSCTKDKIDVIFVWSMDRLGRSLLNLLEILGELKKSHVDLVFHTQNIDTTTAAGRAMFNVMGAFAEFERETIKERIAAGLSVVKAAESDPLKRAARRQAGKMGVGRPQLDESKAERVRRLLRDGKGECRIATDLGIGKGTVARIRREMSQAAA
jgi:DNA invertase Pin-like site-specific DNA recombinase